MVLGRLGLRQTALPRLFDVKCSALRHAHSNARPLQTMISNFKQNPKLRRMLLVQALASLSVGLVGYRYLKTMAGPDEERPLSPFEFVPLKLTSVTRLTADTSLFTLDVAKPRVKGPNQVVSPDTISSLYVMQPDLQIQRPYTVSHLPLLPCADSRGSA